MISRRKLLQRLTFLSLGPSVPAFLAKTVRADTSSSDSRTLVVVQLEGGNDGINTVVPYTDDGYARHRRKLRLPKDQLIRLNDELALHGSMSALGRLWDNDRLAIVQGVGYPNPSRSHDTSMAIWQTASLDPEDHDTEGWLGRELGEIGLNDGSPTAVLVGSQHPPIAIRGRSSVAAAINRIDEFSLPQYLVTEEAPVPQSSDLISFLRKTSLEAYTTASRVRELSAEPDRGARYPGTSLAAQLQLVSRLIKSGLSTRVYYAIQSGYDTHAAQLNDHARLLGELSGAMFAFLEDLRISGLEDRIAILCFSEFGRRVEENHSEGTDHGTAGPVFLAGGAITSGVHGRTPNLEDLEDGDLKMSVDFRCVYASVLKQWLQISPVNTGLHGFDQHRLFGA